MAQPPMPRGSVTSRVACLLLLPLVVVGIYQAGLIALADLAYTSARHETSAWHRNGQQPDLDSISRAEVAIVRALSHTPNNPDMLTLAAQISGWKGHQLAMEQDDPSLAARHYGESLDLLREAARVRPAQAATWALIAEYKTLLGQRDDEWHTAREKALEFGGSNIQIVNRMLAL